MEEMTKEIAQAFWQGCYLVTVYVDGSVSLDGFTFPNMNAARHYAESRGFVILA